MSDAAATPISETLTQKLRDATATAHSGIESRLDLFRPGLTIQRYALLLQCWLAFHEAWEPAAHPWFSSHGNYFPSRSKIDLLKRDLAACHIFEPNHSCDLGEIVPLDYATALGTLYVVEGSTLGGQIIAPKIRELLHLSPGHGDLFFTSYGPQIGSRWAETKRLLNETPSPSHPRVIKTAIATFAFLADWLAPECLKR